MSSLERERSVAVDLARAGADLAQQYLRGGAKILRMRNKPLGGGPVTAADEAIDAHIVGGLREAFPQDSIVAEESHPEENEDVWGRGGRCWLVDPIDGTREYARGTPGWTVQIGLCIEGRPVLGVVIEPAHGRTSWAMLEGHGTASAHWTGQTTVQGQEPQPLRVAENPWNRLRLIGGQIYPFSRQNAIRRVLGISSDRASAVGSVGVRMTAVARGEADAYVQAPGKTKMWDTGPPQALVLAAGGRVTDLRGQPLNFDAPPITHPYGVVACAASQHEPILARLADLAARWLDDTPESKA